MIVSFISLQLDANDFSPFLTLVSTQNVETGKDEKLNKSRVQGFDSLPTFLFPIPSESIKSIERKVQCSPCYMLYFILHRPKKSLSKLDTQTHTDFLKIPQLHNS